MRAGGRLTGNEVFGVNRLEASRPYVLVADSQMNDRFPSPLAFPAETVPFERYVLAQKDRSPASLPLYLADAACGFWWSQN